MASTTLRRISTLSAFTIMAASLAACGKDDGPRRIKDTQVEPPGPNCEFGGHVVLSGIDANEDGKLSASEIDKKEYQCNADPGGSNTGTERLNKEYNEPPGENCEFGGIVKVTGIDKNEDGELSNSEIDGRTYVCDTDTPVSDAIRLNDAIPEPASPNCPYSGTALRTGLDENDDGVLQADEVDGISYICNTVGSPSPFLIDVEVLAVGDAQCAHGGTVTHSGIDADENGVLDVSERDDSLVHCTAAPGVCNGVAPLSVEFMAPEVDPFGYYLQGETYEVRVTLSRAVDADSLVVVQSGTDFTPAADFSADIDPSDPKVLLVNYIATPTGAYPATLLIADECGLTAGSVDLGSGAPVTSQVIVTVTDFPIAAGDTIEYCWESRNADTCVHKYGPWGAETITPLSGPSGCATHVVVPGDLNGDWFNGGQVHCHDSGSALPAGIGAVSKSIVPKVISFTNVSSRSHGPAGGYTALRWSTVGIESCVLRYNGVDTVVPTQAPDRYLLHVVESGTVDFICKDANGTEYRGPSTTYVQAGPGINSANGYIINNGGMVEFTFNASSKFLDGACEGTLTFNGEDRAIPSTQWVQNTSTDTHVYHLTNTIVFNDLPYGPPGEGAVDMTCTSADASYTQSVRIEF